MNIGDTLLLNAVVEGIFGHRFAADEVFLHDVFHPFWSHLSIVSLIRENVDHRTYSAGAHTTTLDNSHFIGKAGLFQLFHHGVSNIFTTGRHTAGAVTYHAQVAVLAHLLQISLLHMFQIFNASDHALAPPSVRVPRGSSYWARMPRSFAGVTCL